MARGSVKKGKLLYHLTSLKHLDSILSEGLLPRSKLINNIEFKDIADKQIISQRNTIGLSEYIPFHFHPYSSFDVAVRHNYFEEEFIYVCITRELARYNNFKILIKHPLSIEDFILLDYEKGFEEIDWEAMDTLGTEDNYIKQVKMAECLTNLIIPARLFQCIGVRNEEIKEIVEDKLIDHGIIRKPPYVDIRKWF